MIGQKFNFDEVFFRDLTVCVLDTLEGRLNWINRFSSGNIPVSVPIYYSMTGDDRFLLDSFQDDIVSENRYVELNTDQIPRGHLTLNNFNIRSDEFRNPNIWLRTVVEDDAEVKKLLKKVRAIPISVTYDLTILLKNEIDVFKCSQEIMNTLWLYRFMYFEHNYMHIDAVMIMPDNETIQIQREKNLKSDDTVKLTVSIEVQTYYPAFISGNDDKIKSIVTKVENTKSVRLNTIDGIFIGQVLTVSDVPYSVKVVDIFPEANIVVFSTDGIDLFSGQQISFTSSENNYEVSDVFGPVISLEDTSQITIGSTISSSNIVSDIFVEYVDVESGFIIPTTDFNFIFGQPLVIDDVSYLTQNGDNQINLNSVDGIQVGQIVSGDGIQNFVKVIEVHDTFVLVSKPVEILPGQSLFFGFDNNLNNTIAPYQTKWYKRRTFLLESGIGRLTSLNPSATINTIKYDSK